MAITRCRNKFEQYLWDVNHMSRAKFAHVRNRYQCIECGKWCRYKVRDMRISAKAFNASVPWIGTTVTRKLCPKCQHKWDASRGIFWDLVQTPPNANW